MGNHTSLTHINLSGNQISGQIPKTFATLTSLSSLRINQNSFTGIIPSSLNIENITADCGFPYYDGELECKDCRMCCNSLEECSEKKTGSEQIFQNEVAILWGIPVIFAMFVSFVVFIFSFIKSEICIRTKPLEMCGKTSIYCLVFFEGLWPCNPSGRSLLYFSQCIAISKLFIRR